MNHQIKKWIETLTLEEKAGLCSGLDLWHTKPVDRLGIRSLTMTDGPHGVRLAETGILSQMRIMAMGGKDTIEQSTREATCFPTATAMAATFNKELIEHVGEAMGREAKNLNVDLLLAPGINIIRTPLGGRNFEFFSEDPLLSSSFGIAITKGIQSQGVGAVVKHFACNNSEFRRMTVDVIVDDRSLNELYLRAFYRLIKHVEPMAIMSAYNKINGVYCSQSKALLTTILRERWGYEGLVISDWAAVYNRIDALKAGLDIEMPGFAMHDEEIVQAVKKGLIDESTLDSTVERILKAIAKLDVSPPSSIQTSEHHGLASHVAAESFVLLKNDNQSLPLPVHKPLKIVLLGEGWKSPIIQGEGSSKVRPIKVDDPEEELRKRLHEDTEIVHVNESNQECMSELINADFAFIMCSQFYDGEYTESPENSDGEGGDKKDLSLPDYYTKLIQMASELSEKTIVCIASGGPVMVDDWLEDVDGLMMVWLSGEGLGGALADVLTGVVNPSGKLPVSWPRHIENTSSYLYFPGENDKLYYNDRIFVGYRYSQTTQNVDQFPFGFGLSFTQFSIRKASVHLKEGGPEELEVINSSTGAIKVRVNVLNAGLVAGKAVVQIYSRREVSTIKYPFRQLVAFEKIALQPGESKIVELYIDLEDLSYYNTVLNAYVLEAGEIHLDIGESSESISETLSIRAKSDQVHRPYLSKYAYLSDWLSDPDGKHVILEAIRPFVPFEEIPMEHPVVKMFLEMPLIKIVNFSGGLISEDFLDHLELALIQRKEKG